MKKFLNITLAFFTLITLSATASDGYDIGSKVKDFTLKNVDGKMISLSDYADGKGAIVIFTCNHCPYAKAYEQRIMDLDKQFTPMGFPVIAINPNDPAVQAQDSYENMQKIAKEKGYTFPYLFDEGQKVFPEFGATRTPHVFVLNNGKEGWTVEYIGAIDNNYEDASNADDKYVESAVNALLQGDQPQVTVTKAIGCSIKVKK